MFTQAKQAGWLVVLLVSPTLGGSPGDLAVQGLLKDAGGSLVTGQRNLDIAFYDAEVAGNLKDINGDGMADALDIFNVTAVDVTDGLFSVKIGSLHPSACDGATTWMQISVDGSPLSRTLFVGCPNVSEQVNQPGTGVAAIRVDEATGKVAVGGSVDPTGDLLQVAGVAKSTEVKTDAVVTSLSELPIRVGELRALSTTFSANGLVTNSVETNAIDTTSSIEFKTSGVTRATLAPTGEWAIGAAPVVGGEALQVTGVAKSTEVKTDAVVTSLNELPIRVGELRAIAATFSATGLATNSIATNAIDTTSSIEFKTNGVTRATLAATGEWGIGAAPVAGAEALQVAGVVKAYVPTAGARAPGPGIVLDPVSLSLKTTNSTAPLDIVVDGQCVQRWTPVDTDGGGAVSTNFLAGSPFNNIAAGFVGATVAGGGAAPSAARLLGGGPIPDSVDGQPRALLDNSNRVTSSFGTVAGGLANEAFTGSVVGGGDSNCASGKLAVIAGGNLNLASGDSAAILGGNDNRAFGKMVSIGGSFSNKTQANSLLSTIPGGYVNRAEGSYSFAAGSLATVRNGDSGTFIWADAQGMPADPFPPNPAPTQRSLVSTGPNQFIIRAAGGIWLGTVATINGGDPTREDAIIPAGRFIETSTGAYLSDVGVWTDASDRNKKENFRPVDRAALLDRLSEMPITRWNFKDDDASVQHIGPVAQDFYAALGLGRDDTHIAPLDTAGVALAAIQRMHSMIKEKDARITTLEKRVATLEKAFDELTPSARIGTLGLTVPVLVMAGLIGLAAFGRGRKGGA